MAGSIVSAGAGPPRAAESVGAGGERTHAEVLWSSARLHVFDTARPDDVLTSGRLTLVDLAGSERQQAVAGSTGALPVVTAAALAAAAATVPVPTAAASPVTAPTA